MASKKGGGKSGSNSKWRSIAQNVTANANSENGAGRSSPGSSSGKRGGGKSGKAPFRQSTASNMTNANPELVIMSLRNPNIKNYRGLRNLIRKEVTTITNY